MESKKHKFRNPFATKARLHGGAGSHGSVKKEESREACRRWRYDAERDY